jgi:hypothetical protein
MKIRTKFVSNSSSSSFLIECKARSRQEIIDKFREEITIWAEKVIEAMEEHGIEEYDRRGNIIGISVKTSNERDWGDPYLNSLARLEGLSLNTIEIRNIYIGN